MDNKKENTKENKKSCKGVVKIIIAVVLTAVITYFATINITLKSYLNSSNTAYLATKLSLIKNKLNKESIYDLNEDKMIESALKGYVAGIDDKYTQYLTKEEMDELLEDTTGSYVGIGVYMADNTADNTILIIGVIEGSVAEQAGIKSGDIIKKVDDVEYTGEQLDAVSSKVKGEEGTKVTIEVLRGTEKLKFELTREKVKVNQVEGKVFSNNIGYIKFTSFDETTAEDFKNQYQELAKKGIQSLIIDLRNNGGGLVDEALKIADYIVPKGKELLVTVDKDKNEKIEKSKEDVLIDMPIVVLVNKNSASSSEILAGALKDLEEATIVGTTTYGKGVIQQLLSLKDGSGLKVTVEEYYTPNRTKINGVGIEPNEKVELPETVTNPFLVTRNEDTQLQKAVEILK